MKFENFMAGRYLSTKNKPFFVSFLLWISFLAIATSVFAVVFISAIMNGFQNDFEKRVMAFKAPLTVLARERKQIPVSVEEVKKIDSHIQRVIPFLDGEALLQSSDGENLGVRVRGVLEEPRLERLGEKFLPEGFQEKSLLMGDQLALSLGVDVESTPELRLLFPLGEISPTGDLVPKIRKLKLSGIFHSGYFDYDNKYVFISYSEAERLFNGEVSEGYEIWIDSNAPTESSLKQLKEKIEEKFPQLHVLSWRDQNPKLFAALKLEKVGMLLLLSVLMMVASFNVFGVMTLTILDKKKDMGILLSLGLNPNRLKKIFQRKAILLGMTGSFVGVLIALVGLGLLKFFPFRLPETYYVEFLPIQIRWVEVVCALGMGPLVTFLAAYYPAFQTARLTPIDVLRDGGGGKK